MKNISLRGRPDFQPPLRPLGGCVHHFVIATPDGPTSPGICNNCGAEKEFRNWLHDYIESDYMNRYSRE